MSDDGRHGLTLIAFVGSVFSPYYAWARHRGRAKPHEYCALNVAIYEPQRRLWAMTERTSAALDRTRAQLGVGPSRLIWERSGLRVAIDEIAVPWPRRIRGTVRLHPVAPSADVIELAAAGSHRWWPVAPVARVEVDLDHPALHWRGHGYLDANAGNAPLEDAFVRWDWSRASRGQETVILYDALRRDGSRLDLALRCDSRGRIEPIAPPPMAFLPRSAWGLRRSTRADAGSTAIVLRRLEDGPFYARAVLATRLLGADAVAMHETLSLDRFRSLWVRLLLPFRMPRRFGHGRVVPQDQQLPEGESEDANEDQDSLEKHQSGRTHAAGSFLCGQRRDG